MTSRAEARRNRKHANEIKRREPKPEPGVVAAPKPQPIERDGLKWLGKKGRLTKAQWFAGTHYRALYRDPGGPALPSSLDFSQARVDCGTTHSPNPIAYVDTRRELADLRASILHSHEGMIYVLDEVCGKGRTLRDVAAEDLNARLKAGKIELPEGQTEPPNSMIDRDAGKLETILKVALDLISGSVQSTRMAA